MDGLRKFMSRRALVLLALLTGLLALSFLVERTVSEGETIYHDTAGVVWSPDGSILATRSFDDSTIQLWDVRSRRKRSTPRGQAGHVVFSPDGTLLAATGGGRTIRLWEVSTGQEWRVLCGPDDVCAVAFSPDGRSLATAGKGGVVTLWDVKTGQTSATLRGQEDRVSVLAFSPDGTTLASSGFDETIKLWDVATGKERAALKGHRIFVLSAAFSPDGKTLASADFASDVKLWDIATAAETATLHPEQQGNASRVYYVDSLSFHPDGKTLATLAGDEIELWDVATGARVRAYPSGFPSRSLSLWYWFYDRDLPTPWSDGRETLCSATFRADGKLVVAATDYHSHTVTTWVLPASRK